MKKSNAQIKIMKFYNTKAVSLLIVIILVALSSCSSIQEDITDNMDVQVDVTDTMDMQVDVTDTMDVQLNAPVIQTPAPLIHLADNLDEQDQLGWCIDTRGNGFNENIHLHSCKASGGDVQFIYNKETLQICSAEFANFCIEMSGGSLEGVSLILVESNTDTPDQKFIYNEDSGEFNPEEDTNLCIAAGDTSAAAGIYMSRSLTLELSSETEESLKKWIIVTE